MSTAYHELDSLTPREAKNHGYPVCPCGNVYVDFIRYKRVERRITKSIKKTVKTGIYFCPDCGDEFDEY